MQILIRIVDFIAQGLRLLGALALVFMALSVFYDAMMRYLFLAPTYWSLEINSYLVAFIAFIPAAHVLREREHLCIELVQNRLEGAAASAVNAFIAVVGVIFCSVLVWRGGMIAYDAWFYDERMSTVLGTPTAIPYSFIPVAFTVLGLAFLANLAEALSGGTREKAAID